MRCARLRRARITGGREPRAGGVRTHLRRQARGASRAQAGRDQQTAGEARARRQTRGPPQGRRRVRVRTRRRRGPRAARCGDPVRYRARDLVGPRRARLRRDPGDAPRPQHVVLRLDRARRSDQGRLEPRLREAREPQVDDDLPDGDGEPHRDRRTAAYPRSRRQHAGRDRARGDVTDAGDAGRDARHDRRRGGTHAVRRARDRGDR